MKLTRLLASSVTILLAFGVAGSQSSAIVGSAFDWFGDVNCESEMARLDSLAVTLQSSPNDIAAIIFLEASALEDGCLNVVKLRSVRHG